MRNILRQSARLPRPNTRLPGVEGALLRRLARWGACHGPRWWVEHSPSFFGVVLGLGSGGPRRAVQRNLGAILGQRSRWEELAQTAATFSAYGHCLAESLASERPEALDAKPHIRNRGALDAALSGARGLVIVTAHAGGWDRAAQGLAKEIGRQVLVVMQPEANQAAREFHNLERGQHGVKVVHVAHPLDGLELLRHLRNGGVVAVQIDRVPAGMRSLPVNLFASPFQLPEGPFALAAAAQTPLVSVFARRRGYFDYEMVVGDLIEIRRKAGCEELRQSAQRIAGELEAFVRETPTQWFHFDD